jgi:hypothetical protein
MVDKSKDELNQEVPQEQICWIHNKRKVSMTAIRTPGAPSETIWVCASCMEEESAKNSWEK